ncbi:MAG: OmpA family protein [Magnetococcales bacterium]|nr:OmpA family protein [Magnetococcales bacterium]
MKLMQRSNLTLLVASGLLAVGLSACVTTPLSQCVDPYHDRHHLCSQAQAPAAPKPVAEVTRSVQPPPPAAPMDSDGDGVTDDKDKCPGTPKGAKVNHLGCWVLENLHFNVNKYDIAAKSFPMLNDVVKVMQANPDLRIEVQGHTDSTGSKALNDKLSKNRANAVMKYLSGHGVAANRMTAQGYADTQPIASNADPNGRAQNRRVELKPNR